MTPHLSSTPGFGQANLSNCEREQIHLAASIQPHGTLLVVNGPDHRITQASANAASFLGTTGSVIGRPLTAIGGDLWECIAPHLSDALGTLPIAVRCHFGEPAAEFDGLLHRPPVGGLVIELERAGPHVDLSRHVERSLQTIAASSSARALCDETARIFKDLTGYDRVMVYRFDDDGHGEVCSEERLPTLESYLGNRYPASDIPQIARRLYERNRVRVLADVQCAQVPLTPRFSPVTGQDLDMSLCFLRSMSPIHVQYLKNMGVAATLVASLMVGGRLWGLVACHHYEPRFAHFEVRTVCELLAEAIGTRITALQGFDQAQAELSVFSLERRMIEAISRDGDWRGALFDNQQSLLKPLGATGAALLFEGQILVEGEVPGTQQLRNIGKWLDAKPRAVVATASLGTDVPDFAPLTAVASGLLATPVSNSPGEYLMWFRPERIRTVTWAGNPFKAVVFGDDPADLSPRRSFAQWHQIVEGRSDPWTPADLTTGRLIGDTMTDVLLQFRSVRMLIAQDQFALVRTQVQQAEQPLIMADADGRITLINHAFERLLPMQIPPLETLDALPGMFLQPSEIRRRLRDLVEERRTWRGEVSLKSEHQAARPLLARADPVFSAPGRVLGFVILFTDINERKAVEAARHRLQEGILRVNRNTTVRLDPQAARLYHDLLSSVVENAQLAALEISEGSDTERMAEILDSVRFSVGRTAELLQHLVCRSSRASVD